MKQAGKKVCDFLLHADHSITPRPRNKDEAQSVVDWVARSTGTLLVKEARNYRQPLPYVENLADGTTWHLSAGASLHDPKTGQIIASGPGVASACPHLALFEKASDARQRAVDNVSYEELLTAISLGQASIEGLLAYLVKRWNDSCPKAQSLHDRHLHRVTIAEKIHDWYPRMTGARLSKNARVWQKFVSLKRLRNKEAAHPQNDSYCVRHQHLARLVNDFRCGIALLFGQLHLRAGYRIPQVVLKAYYYPDVKIATED